jgi:hypothetical protein
MAQKIMTKITLSMKQDKAAVKLTNNKLNYLNTIKQKNK